MPKTTRFDATDYLDSEARQVAYIAMALESGEPDFVRDALGLVARARGMGGIARKAGLNRVRNGDAYCSGFGSNAFSAPNGEWTGIKAPGRLIGEIEQTIILAKSEICTKLHSGPSLRSLS